MFFILDFLNIHSLTIKKINSLIKAKDKKSRE